MGLHAAPSLDDNNFHFHMEFYPPLRHGDKPKVLAGYRWQGIYYGCFSRRDWVELRKFMS